MNHRQLSVSSFAFGAIAVGLSACHPEITIGSLSSGTSGPGSGTQSCSASAVVLAPFAQGAPRIDFVDIAYADDWVYFESTPPISGVPEEQWTSEVWRVPVTGGTPVELASGLPFVVQIAASPTDVFIGEADGSVWQMPAVGGTPLLVNPGGSTPSLQAVRLAVSDTDLVMGDGEGSIRRAPIGGGPTVELYPPTPGEEVWQIAVDATNVYWVALKGNASDVNKVPLAGGPSTVLASLPTTSFISIDGDSVYASQLGSMAAGAGSSAVGDGSILRIRIDQSEGPTLIAAHQPLPGSIVADATGVYWSTVTSQPSVNHVVPDKSAIAPISLNQRVGGMTPCSNGVCWIDTNTNSVMRYEECSP